MKLLLGTGLLLLCLIVACNPVAEQKVVTDPDTSSVYIELLHTYKTFQRTFGDCDSDTTSSCTSITLMYPHFSGTLNPTAETTVNTAILEFMVGNILYDSSIYASYEDFASAFINEYEDVKSEFEEAFGWQYDGDVTVLRNDPHLLAIRFDTYLYTGGAHGKSAIRYLNLHPETGKPMTIQDFFRDSFEKSLNEIARNAFMRQKGLASSEELQEHGFWFEDENYFTDNITLLKDSLLLYYNQYEVAPYAYGPTRIAVPIDSIQHILTPGFNSSE